MDWLSKIDPNTIIGLGGLIATLATWTWHKLRGDKQDSFTDTIRGLGKQAVHVLLMDPSITLELAPDTLQTKAVTYLWALATGIGVPRNAITEAIVTATAQHVVGDLLDELRGAQALPAKVAALSDQVAAIPASIAAAEAKGFAAGKAWFDANAEPADPLPTATALPPK